MRERARSIEAEPSKFNRLFEIVSLSGEATDVQTQVMRITIGPMMEAGRQTDWNTLVVSSAGIRCSLGLCNRPPGRQSLPLCIHTHTRCTVGWLTGWPGTRRMQTERSVENGICVHQFDTIAVRAPCEQHASSRPNAMPNVMRALWISERRRKSMRLSRKNACKQWPFDNRFTAER